MSFDNNIRSASISLPQVSLRNQSRKRKSEEPEIGRIGQKSIVKDLGTKRYKTPDHLPKISISPEESIRQHHSFLYSEKNMNQALSLEGSFRYLLKDTVPVGSYVIIPSSKLTIFKESHNTDQYEIKYLLITKEKKSVESIKYNYELWRDQKYIDGGVKIYPIGIDRNKKICFLNIQEREEEFIIELMDKYNRIQDLVEDKKTSLNFSTAVSKEIKEHLDSEKKLILKNRFLDLLNLKYKDSHLSNHFGLDFDNVHNSNAKFIESQFSAEEIEHIVKYSRYPIIRFIIEEIKYELDSYFISYQHLIEYFKNDYIMQALTLSDEEINLINENYLSIESRTDRLDNLITNLNSLTAILTELEETKDAQYFEKLGVISRRDHDKDQLVAKMKPFLLGDEKLTENKHNECKNCLIQILREFKAPVDTHTTKKDALAERVNDLFDIKFPISQKSLQMTSELFPLEREIKLNLNLKSNLLNSSVNTVYKIGEYAKDTQAYFKKDIYNSEVKAFTGIRFMEELMWQISLIFNMEKSFTATKTVYWPSEIPKKNYWDGKEFFSNSRESEFKNEVHLLKSKDLSGTFGSLQKAQPGAIFANISDKIEEMPSREEVVRASIISMIFGMYDAHHNNVIISKNPETNQNEVKFFDNTRSMPHSNHLINFSTDIYIPFRIVLMELTKFYTPFTAVEKEKIEETIKGYSLKLPQVKEYLRNNKKILKLPPHWLDTELAISALEKRMSTLVNAIKQPNVNNLMDLVIRVFPNFKLVAALHILGSNSSLFTESNIDIQTKYLKDLGSYNLIPYKKYIKDSGDYRLVPGILDKVKDCFNLEIVRDFCDKSESFDEVLDNLRTYVNSFTVITPKDKILNHISYEIVKNDLLSTAMLELKDCLEKPCTNLLIAYKNIKKAGFIILHENESLDELWKYPRPMMFFTFNSPDANGKLLFNCFTSSGCWEKYNVDFTTKRNMIHIEIGDETETEIPAIKGLGFITPELLHTSLLPRSYWMAKDMEHVMGKMMEAKPDTYCIAFDVNYGNYVVVWKNTSGDIQQSYDLFDKEELKKDGVVTIPAVESYMLNLGYIPA